MFEFEPSVRDGALGGPYVQGPPKERFIYIGIGTFAGNAASCWSRRLKVPLTDITAKMAVTGGVLEARVAGTGRDGTPSCATVREFDGWKAVKR